MPTPPLSGPHGLYTVSVMPRFLADSSRVGWSGVFFTDIQAVPEGRVDHGHARLCIRRTLQRESRRCRSDAPWESVAPAVHVLGHGDEERFDWRQAGRAQFLFVDDVQVAHIIGTAPRRLAGQGTLDAAASRLPALLLDALLVDLDQGSPAGPLVGESIVAALVSHLARTAPARDETLEARGRHRALDLIEARFAEPIGLDELARAAGLSVRHFTRAFRATVGCSPHQYILRRRIDHAKALILQGLPLADAAGRCGFSDQSQLTRIFARHTGTTPGRFRDRS